MKNVSDFVIMILNTDQTSEITSFWIKVLFYNFHRTRIIFMYNNHFSTTSDLYPRIT